MADNTGNGKLVVTADPAGVNYSQQVGNNPQNIYRSYDNIAIWTDPNTYSAQKIDHQRLSHYAVIKRANGGGPNDTDTPGRFVSDN